MVSIQRSVEEASCEARINEIANEGLDSKQVRNMATTCCGCNLPYKGALLLKGNKSRITSVSLAVQYENMQVTPLGWLMGEF